MIQVNSPRYRLPTEATSFVGRAFALTEIHRLLGETRLLTLVGPGGGGKTRLAIRAATEASDSFPDGLVLADLATVSNPELLAPAVAAALGIGEQSDVTAVEALMRSVGSRRVLLILDNCEHLIDGCAWLCEILLANSTDLRILATSREPLRAQGETVWTVTPLALPTQLSPRSLELLEQVDAVKLFLDRARARQPGFLLTQESAKAVVQVCRRLDGLPLAIELAAAQMGAVSVEQLVAHLDNMLGLLTGGRRSVGRHETIRATIDWSHGLLCETDQVLFRRLAVFIGGFDLAAAQAVCGDVSDAGPVMAGLIRLVGRSLVVAETSHSEARYRLLEPIRQYAVERLRKATEVDDVERRQAEHFLTLIIKAEPGLMSAHRQAWLIQLQECWDNVREAFAWALSSRKQECVELALRAAGTLFWFSLWEGNASEARGWAEEALATAGDDAAHAIRAKALFSAGSLAYILGDLPGANARLKESASLYRQLGDTYWLAYPLLFLDATADPGSAAAGSTSTAEATAIFHDRGDLWGYAAGLHFSGLAALSRGDYAEAAEAVEQSVALFQQHGDSWELGQVLNLAGDIARVQGQDAEASAFYEKSLQAYASAGAQMGTPSLLHNLGYMALRQGDPRQARRFFQDSLSMFEERGDNRGMAECIAGVAAALNALGQPIEAARLFGAAEALFSASSTRIWPANKVDHQRNLDLTRVRLGETDFNTALGEGRTMALEEALVLASLVRSGDQAAPLAVDVQSDKAGRLRLSQRELEIAALVAQGLTSRQIGERVFITEGTAALHVKHILAKLGFTSRAQVAAWAVDQKLAPPPTAAT